jgi:hypothetical protein
MSGLLDAAVKAAAIALVADELEAQADVCERRAEDAEDVMSEYETTGSKARYWGEAVANHGAARRLRQRANELRGGAK